MTVFSPDPEHDFSHAIDSRMLEPRQINMIEEAIRSVGDYGEVRLIIEKGKLRFLVTQKSFDTMKWQPGALNTEA